MHLKYESQLREPLVYGDKTYKQVTEDIVRPIEANPTKLWYVGFYIAVALFGTKLWKQQDDTVNLIKLNLADRNVNDIVTNGRYKGTNCN